MGKKEIIKPTFQERLHCCGTRGCGVAHQLLRLSMLVAVAAAASLFLQGCDGMGDISSTIEAPCHREERDVGWVSPKKLLRSDASKGNCGNTFPTFRTGRTQPLKSARTLGVL